MGEFESALLNEFEAGLIVGKGVAVEEGDVLGHGDSMIEVFGELVFLTEAFSIALEFVKGDGEGPFVLESGDGSAKAEFFEPGVELLAMVVGEVFEFGNGLDGGVHWG